MSRTMDYFSELMNQLACDTELFDFYMSITTDENGDFYPELVTTAVIMEMEASVLNCVTPD